MVGKLKMKTNDEWQKWISISDSNCTDKTFGISGNCEILQLEYVHSCDLRLFFYTITRLHKLQIYYNKTNTLQCSILFLVCYRFSW